MNFRKDHSLLLEEQKPLISVDIAELYFLIQKLLLCSPLSRTKKVLLQEIQEHDIYRNRLDWEGNEHKRSFKDMEHQFSFIRPDYLLQISSHIANISSEYSLSLNPRGNVKSMLKFKPMKLKQSDHNFRQLFSFITRLHGTPLRNKDMRSNIGETSDIIFHVFPVNSYPSGLVSNRVLNIEIYLLHRIV